MSIGKCCVFYGETYFEWLRWPHRVAVGAIEVNFRQVNVNFNTGLKIRTMFTLLERRAVLHSIKGHHLSVWPGVTEVFYVYQCANTFGFHLFNYGVLFMFQHCGFQFLNVACVDTKAQQLINTTCC